MKRPPGKVMLVGHPLVAIPMMLSVGVMLVAALKDGILFVILLAVAMLLSVGAAYNQASAYRAWKRDWDAMAPEEAPRNGKRTPAWLTIIVLGIGTFTALWLYGETTHEAARHVAELGGGIGVVAILWAAIRRLGRRRRQPAGSFTVAVVARPVMAVPSLDDAYRTLPPYCHALLRGRQ